MLIDFSRQPLVHTVIFLIEMAILGRLAAKFNSYYADRPGTYLHFIVDDVMLMPLLQCSR